MNRALECLPKPMAHDVFFDAQGDYYWDISTFRRFDIKY